MLNTILSSEILFESYTCSAFILLVPDEVDFRCNAERMYDRGLEECRIRQDLRDDSLNWIRRHSKTPTGERFTRKIGDRVYPSTGPSFASEGFYYMYLEADDTEANEVAR